MSHYASASIRNKFLEEGNLIDPQKVKINRKLGEIRATIKLHCFDQLHLIQYIEHHHLKGGK